MIKLWRSQNQIQHSLGIRPNQPWITGFIALFSLLSAIGIKDAHSQTIVDCMTREVEAGPDLPQVRPGERFDLNDPPPGVLSRGRLYSTEAFFNTATQTVVVWTKGPSAGRVFRVFDRPTSEQLSKLPSMANIEATIDSRILEASKLKDGTEARSKIIADLVVWLHSLYDGAPGRVGLRVARFYNPQYLEFIEAFEKKGWYKWLEERARAAADQHPELKGFRAFTAITSVDEALKRYFHIPAGSPPKEEPIVLSHGTFDIGLSGILNARGIYSDDERPGGMPRLTGESYGIGGMTPWAVSFWHDPNGLYPVKGGFASNEGLAMPIAFGIRASTAKKLNFDPGPMPKEMVVRGHVDLDQIDFLYVPYFAVDEYRTLLHAHGFNHIEVRPLELSP